MSAAKILWGQIPKAVSRSAIIEKKTSHALLVGAILPVLCAGADKSLAGVAAFLSNPDETIENTLYAMMDTPHLGEAGPHRIGLAR